MISLGSVSGAVVYWMFITSIGVLLAGGGLLELRRRGRPPERWHLVTAGVTVLGFAALGYTGVWRSFYSVARTESGLALTYHWPSRQVLVPWDSVKAVNTAPGYKGQRPLRVIARNGRQYVSAMIPVREALRLSRCLSGDVSRHQGSATPEPAGECP